MDKRALIHNFPKLIDDPYFEITSPEDRKYNCLAWALGYNDRWMQPFPDGIFDGVWVWWPKSTERGIDIPAYIKAFEMYGFEICENFELEKGYVKIALYEKMDAATGSLMCSHGARQLISGKWQSKLGPSNDIIHGTPFTLEGISYGNVKCCMKMKR